MEEINLKNITPDIRHIDDMRDVMFDKNFAKNAENADLYFMYRGIEKTGDIRYDITVISAKMLGNEFNKTKGHYHIGAYPEIYTVLEGSAIYLMQKTEGNTNIISDVYAVKANKGDVVIIPPFYGHVTINPSENQELKMANWLCDKCKSNYSSFVQLQGACYYYTQNGWIKNENYKSIPELRFEEPTKEVPQNLEFLNKG